MIGRLSWSGMGYFHFCSSFSVLMSVTLPRLTKHRPIPAAHILLLGIGNKLLFYSFMVHFELFFYNYRHCTNSCSTLFKLACADFKHFSMYFFQPVAEINTFLFRSEFPVLAGYCCKRAAFFQSIIHKPDMLYILITGKRRICNNLSVMPYTVFRKVFIKQYYVVKGVKKFSVFRHQLITFHCYRRTSSMNGFNESTGGRHSVPVPYHPHVSLRQA